MTKLSRKLLISVFALAFALITLGASTFAWFTLTSVAEIDSLDMDIIAGNFMEISLDGDVYKTFFTSDEIKGAIIEGDGVGELRTLPRLDAVTTTDGKTFLDLEDGTTNSYLSFKIWFKSYEEGSMVYLDSGTEVASTSKLWKSDQRFQYRGGTVEVNQELPIFAGNAMRFSIEETDNTHLAPLEEGIGMNIFELGHDDVNTPDRRLDQETKTDGLLAYWLAKTEEEIDVEEGFLPEVLDRSHLGSAATAQIATTHQVVEVEGQNTSYIGFAIVRIWLEGWDPDCFDAVLNSKMSITFSFSVAVPAVPEP